MVTTRNEAAAIALPAALAIELAALTPFASRNTALDVCNGANGGRGIRQKYLSRLSAANLTDPLFYDLAAQINQQLDDAIAAAST